MLYLEITDFRKKKEICSNMHKKKAAYEKKEHSILPSIVVF
jgi:hypothetical protein